MSRILIIGGWPRSLVNFRGALIEELLKRGHEVDICAGGNDLEVEKWARETGATYHPLPIDRTGLNPFKDIGLIIQLIRLIKNTDSDVVLAYTIKPIVYGLIAARICGVKSRYALITGLGSTFLKPRTFGQYLASKIVPVMYKLSLLNCSNVFFQNADDKNEFLNRNILLVSASYSLVNGSGVDTDFFKPVSFPENKMVFLLIARLLNDKGIIEYVEAAKIIKKENNDISFKILGPLDNNPSALKKHELEKWVDEGIIEYLGEASDVRPYIASSTIYVLPSYREGTPRTVLEAMAMGRPIITTNAPGCRETVTNGKNGFLVAIRNIDELADAMRKFINNKELVESMGMASREIVESKFDVHLVNAKMISVMGL